MPAKNTLPRPDFDLFLSQKITRLGGEFFSLAFPCVSLGGLPQVACVISKKVTKSAAKRNHIKRQVREIIRPLLVDIKKPAYLVFYANKASVQATYKDLSGDIKNLLLRLQ